MLTCQGVGRSENAALADFNPRGKSKAASEKQAGFGELLSHPCPVSLTEQDQNSQQQMDTCPPDSTL